MHIYIQLYFVILIFSFKPLLSSQEDPQNDLGSQEYSNGESNITPHESSSEYDRYFPNMTDIKTKFLPPLLDGQPCYPQGANGAAQFLIGYGSLMQKASKDRSYPGTGESTPIRVYGYTRSWTCKGESVGFSTTYLGTDADNSKTAYFNAVFFKVLSAAAIAVYDTREEFYCREEVPISRMQLLSNKTRMFPPGQYWLYVTRPEYREMPTEEYPIVQSYVDTFLSGCLEIEEKHNLPGYAEECVNTTLYWESPWKNDRIFPRRPFLHFPMAGKVDRLLNKTAHTAYENIQIEG